MVGCEIGRGCYLGWPQSTLFCIDTHFFGLGTHFLLSAPILEISPYLFNHHRARESGVPSQGIGGAQLRKWVMPSQEIVLWGHRSY